MTFSKNDDIISTNAVFLFVFLLYLALDGVPGLLQPGVVVGGVEHQPFLQIPTCVFTHLDKRVKRRMKVSIIQINTCQLNPSVEFNFDRHQQFTGHFKVKLFYLVCVDEEEDEENKFSQQDDQQNNEKLKERKVLV